MLSDLYTLRPPKTEGCLSLNHYSIVVCLSKVEEHLK